MQHRRGAVFFHKRRKIRDTEGPLPAEQPCGAVISGFPADSRVKSEEFRLMRDRSLTEHVCTDVT